MNHFRQKERKISLPFCILIIHPQVSLIEAQVKEIKDFLIDFSLILDFELKLSINEQILENISRVQNFSMKDFFEFSIGDCFICIFKTKSADTALNTLKEITDKADQSKSEIIKNLFKTKKIIFSIDLKISKKIAELLQIKTPFIELPFEYNRLFLNEDKVCKFLQPIDQNHPVIVNRLDMLAIYGPSTGDHKISDCFCKNCQLIIKEKMSQVHSDLKSPIKKLKESDIQEYFPILCNICQNHITKVSHIFSGFKEEHILNDKELNQMVFEENYNDLIEAIMKVDKNYNKLLIKKWNVEQLLSDYSIVDVKEILKLLKKDEFGRFHFYDFQDLVLEDRKIRLNYMTSNVLNISVENVWRANPVQMINRPERKKPLDVINKENFKKKFQIELGTNLNEKIKSKMSSGEKDLILDKIFHKNSHKVISLDRVYSDLNKIRNAFLMLKG